MDAEVQAMARRAVASKHWRWMPGMVCIDPETGHDYRMIGHTMLGPKVIEIAFGRKANVEEDGVVTGLDDRVQRAFAAGPDLTDPATLGCLLELVREAWNDQTLSAHYIGWLKLWEMIPMDDNRRPLGQLCGSSEVESLVLALEAAP